MARRGLSTFDLQEDLRLHVIPGFVDNYFYVLERPSSKECAVVDPGDALPIQEYISTHKLQLTQILITHHHRDHTGGLIKLLESCPDARLICSEWFRIPVGCESYKCSRLAANRMLSVQVLNCEVTAIDVRGHTLDHIAYCLWDKNNSKRGCDVFIGDALFGAGCGGLFEGSYEQMFLALSNIRSLPQNARLWCAHEYTVKNLRVAVLLGEQNKTQSLRLKNLEQILLENKVAPHEWMTIPLELFEEIETNPFLRWDQPCLQKAVDTSNDLATFTYVRKFRDRY